MRRGTCATSATKLYRDEDLLLIFSSRHPSLQLTITGCQMQVLDVTWSQRFSLATPPTQRIYPSIPVLPVTLSTHPPFKSVETHIKLFDSVVADVVGALPKLDGTLHLSGAPETVLDAPDTPSSMSRRDTASPTSGKTTSSEMDSLTKAGDSGRVDPARTAEKGHQKVAFDVYFGQVADVTVELTNTGRLHVGKVEVTCKDPVVLESTMGGGVSFRQGVQRVGEAQRRLTTTDVGEPGKGEGGAKGGTGVEKGGAYLVPPNIEVLDEAKRKWRMPPKAT